MTDKSISNIHTHTPTTQVVGVTLAGSITRTQAFSVTEGNDKAQTLNIQSNGKIRSPCYGDEVVVTDNTLFAKNEQEQIRLFGSADEESRCWAHLINVGIYDDFVEDNGWGMEVDNSQNDAMIQEVIENVGYSREHYTIVEPTSDLMEAFPTYLMISGQMLEGFLDFMADDHLLPDFYMVGANTYHVDMNLPRITKTELASKLKGVKFSYMWYNEMLDEWIEVSEKIYSNIMCARRHRRDSGFITLTGLTNDYATRHFDPWMVTEHYQTCLFGVISTAKRMMVDEVNISERSKYIKIIGERDAKLVHLSHARSPFDVVSTAATSGSFKLDLTREEETVYVEDPVVIGNGDFNAYLDIAIHQTARAIGYDQTQYGEIVAGLVANQPWYNGNMVGEHLISITLDDYSDETDIMYGIIPTISEATIGELGHGIGSYAIQNGHLIYSAYGTSICIEVKANVHELSMGKNNIQIKTENWHLLHTAVIGPFSVMALSRNKYHVMRHTSANEFAYFKVPIFKQGLLGELLLDLDFVDIKLNKTLLSDMMAKNITGDLGYRKMVSYGMALAWMTYSKRGDVFRAMSLGTNDIKMHAYVCQVMIGRDKLSTDVLMLVEQNNLTRVAASLLNSMITATLRFFNLEDTRIQLPKTTVNIFRSNMQYWWDIDAWAFDGRIEKVIIERTDGCTHHKDCDDQQTGVQCICCSHPTATDLFCTHCKTVILDCGHLLSNTTDGSKTCSCCGKAAPDTTCINCLSASDQLVLNQDLVTLKTKQDGRTPVRLDDQPTRTETTAGEPEPNEPRSVRDPYNRPSQARADLSNMAVDQPITNEQLSETFDQRTYKIITSNFNELEEIADEKCSYIPGVPAGNWTMPLNLFNVISTVDNVERNITCGISALKAATNEYFDNDKVHRIIGEFGDLTGQQLLNIAKKCGFNLAVGYSGSLHTFRSDDSDLFPVILHGTETNSNEKDHWLNCKLVFKRIDHKWFYPTRFATAAQYQSLASRLFRRDYKLLTESEAIRVMWQVEMSHGIKISSSIPMLEVDGSRLCNGIGTNLGAGTIDIKFLDEHSHLLVAFNRMLQNRILPDELNTLFDTDADKEKDLKLMRDETIRECLFSLGKIMTSEDNCVMDKLPVQTSLSGLMLDASSTKLKTWDIITVLTDAGYKKMMVVVDKNRKIFLRNASREKSKGVITVLIPKASAGSILRKLIGLMKANVDSDAFNKVMAKAKVIVRPGGGGKSTLAAQMMKGKNFTAVACTSGGVKSLTSKIKGTIGKICSMERLMFDGPNDGNILLIDEATLVRWYELGWCWRSNIDQIIIMGDPTQIGIIDMQVSGGARVEMSVIDHFNKADVDLAMHSYRYGASLVAQLTTIKSLADLTSEAQHDTTVTLDYMDQWDGKRLYELCMDHDVILTFYQPHKAKLLKLVTGTRLNVLTLKEVETAHVFQGLEANRVLVVQAELGNSSVHVSEGHVISACTRAVFHLTFLSIGIFKNTTRLSERCMQRAGMMRKMFKLTPNPDYAAPISRGESSRVATSVMSEIAAGTFSTPETIHSRRLGDEMARPLIASLSVLTNESPTDEGSRFNLGRVDSPLRIADPVNEAINAALAGRRLATLDYDNINLDFVRYCLINRFEGVASDLSVTKHDNQIELHGKKWMMSFFMHINADGSQKNNIPGGYGDIIYNMICNLSVVNTSAEELKEISELTRKMAIPPMKNMNLNRVTRCLAHMHKIFSGMRYEMPLSGVLSGYVVTTGSGCSACSSVNITGPNDHLMIGPDYHNWGTRLVDYVEGGTLDSVFGLTTGEAIYNPTMTFGIDMSSEELNVCILSERIKIAVIDCLSTRREPTMHYYKQENELIDAKWSEEIKKSKFDAYHKVSNWPAYGQNENKVECIISADRKTTYTKAAIFGTAKFDNQWMTMCKVAFWQDIVDNQKNGLFTLMARAYTTYSGAYESLWQTVEWHARHGTEAYHAIANKLVAADMQVMKATRRAIFCSLQGTKHLNELIPTLKVEALHNNILIDARREAIDTIIIMTYGKMCDAKVVCLGTATASYNTSSEWTVLQPFWRSLDHHEVSSNMMLNNHLRNELTRRELNEKDIDVQLAGKGKWRTTTGMTNMFGLEFHDMPKEAQWAILSESGMIRFAMPRIIISSNLDSVSLTVKDSTRVWDVSKDLYDSYACGEVYRTTDGLYMVHTYVTYPDFALCIITKSTMWMEPLTSGMDNIVKIDIPLVLVDPLEILDKNSALRTKTAMLNCKLLNNLRRRMLREDTSYKDLLAQARTLYHSEIFTHTRSYRQYKMTAADIKSHATMAFLMESSFDWTNTPTTMLVEAFDPINQPVLHMLSSVFAEVLTVGFLVGKKKLKENNEDIKKIMGWVNDNKDCVNEFVDSMKKLRVWCDVPQRKLVNINPDDREIVKLATLGLDYMWELAKASFAVTGKMMHLKKEVHAKFKVNNVDNIELMDHTEHDPSSMVIISKTKPASFDVWIATDEDNWDTDCIGMPSKCSPFMTKIKIRARPMFDWATLGSFADLTKMGDITNFEWMTIEIGAGIVPVTPQTIFAETISGINVMAVCLGEWFDTLILVDDMGVFLLTPPIMWPLHTIDTYMVEDGDGGIKFYISNTSSGYKIEADTAINERIIQNTDNCALCHGESHISPCVTCIINRKNIVTKLDLVNKNAEQIQYIGRKGVGSCSCEKFVSGMSFGVCFTCCEPLNASDTYMVSDEHGGPVLKESTHIEYDFDCTANPSTAHSDYVKAGGFSKVCDVCQLNFKSWKDRYRDKMESDDEQDIPDDDDTENEEHEDLKPKEPLDSNETKIEGTSKTAQTSNVVTRSSYVPPKTSNSEIGKPTEKWYNWSLSDDEKEQHYSLCKLDTRSTMMDLLGVFTGANANETRFIISEVANDPCYNKIKEEKHMNVVLDIGANVGLFAYHVMKTCHVNENTKIHCFEPSQINMNKLSILNFMYRNNIIRNRVAVSHTAGVGKFSFYPNQPGCSTLSMNDTRSYVNKDGVSTYDVELITLKDYFKDNQINLIDVMKIDVEGAELDILSGIGVGIRFVRTIIVECYHNGTNKNCDKVSRLINSTHIETIHNVTGHNCTLYLEHKDRAMIDLGKGETKSELYKSDGRRIIMEKLTWLPKYNGELTERQKDIMDLLKSFKKLPLEMMRTRDWPDERQNYMRTDTTGLTHCIDTQVLHPTAMSGDWMVFIRDVCLWLNESGMEGDDVVTVTGIEPGHVDRSPNDHAAYNLCFAKQKVDGYYTFVTGKSHGRMNACYRLLPYLLHDEECRFVMRGGRTGFHGLYAEDYLMINSKKNCSVGFYGKTFHMDSAILTIKPTIRICAELVSTLINYGPVYGIDEAVFPKLPKMELLYQGGLGYFNFDMSELNAEACKNHDVQRVSLPEISGPVYKVMKYDAMVSYLNLGYGMDVIKEIDPRFIPRAATYIPCVTKYEKMAMLNELEPLKSVIPWSFREGMSNHGFTIDEGYYQWNGHLISDFSPASSQNCTALSIYHNLLQFTEDISIAVMNTKLSLPKFATVEQGKAIITMLGMNYVIWSNGTYEARSNGSKQWVGIGITSNRDGTYHMVSLNCEVFLSKLIPENKLGDVRKTFAAAVDVKPSLLVRTKMRWPNCDKVLGRQASPIIHAKMSFDSIYIDIRDNIIIPDGVYAVGTNIGVVPVHMVSNKGFWMVSGNIWYVSNCLGKIGITDNAKMYGQQKTVLRSGAVYQPINNETKTFMKRLDPTLPIGDKGNRLVISNYDGIKHHNNNAFDSVRERTSASLVTIPNNNAQTSVLDLYHSEYGPIMLACVEGRPILTTATSGRATSLITCIFNMQLAVKPENVELIKLMMARARNLGWKEVGNRFETATRKTGLGINKKDVLANVPGLAENIVDQINSWNCEKVAILEVTNEIIRSDLIMFEGYEDGNFQNMWFSTGEMFVSITHGIIIKPDMSGASSEHAFMSVFDMKSDELINKGGEWSIKSSEVSNLDVNLTQMPSMPQDGMASSKGEEIIVIESTLKGYKFTESWQGSDVVNSELTVEPIPASTMAYHEDEVGMLDIDLPHPKTNIKMRVRETNVEIKEIVKSYLTEYPTTSRPTYTKRWKAVASAASALYGGLMNLTDIELDASEELTRLRETCYIKDHDSARKHYREKPLSFNYEDMINWIKERPGNSSVAKECLEVLSEGLNQHPMNMLNIHAKLESRVKDLMIEDEQSGLLDADDMNNYRTRLIVWQKKGITALFSPIFIAAKARFKSLLNSDKVIYTDGLTPQDISAILRNVKSDENTYICEDDLEKQDRQTKPTLIKVEMEWYQQDLGVHPFVISLWRVAHEHWIAKNPEIKLGMDGMRQTGQATTAIGNAFVNCLVKSRLLKKLGKRVKLMLILGDDNALIIDGWISSQSISENSARFYNMISKPYVSKEVGTYLRMGIYKTTIGTFECGPDIVRLRRRFEITNGVSEASSENLKARCLSYCHMLGKSETTSKVMQVHGFINVPDKWYDQDMLTRALAIKYETTVGVIESNLSQLIDMMCKLEVINVSKLMMVQGK